MQTQEPGAKDPTVAVVLSLFFPGLGHLYAGKVAPFLIFLVLEIWLVAHSMIAPLVILHLFQAIAAGGAAKLWNQQRAAATQVSVPPPPVRGARATATRPVADDVPPIPMPPPIPARAAPAVLDADAFLAELQSAWRDHRASTITAREFADRKWRAIRAVRVGHGEEGDALVAAAHHLAEAGVLTSEDIGQLDARVKS